MSHPNMQRKMIYNDVIDEAYELEDAEDVIEETKIRNQIEDGEVNVSDDSQNYIPTPRESASEIMPSHQIKNFEDNLSSADDQNFRKTKPVISISKVHEELKSLNLDSRTLEIFKYLPAYIPQEQELDTQLKPFIPEFIPAIGEVDAFLKVPRPDGKEEPLGIEKLDE